jgi:hypothetical protein
LIAGRVEFKEDGIHTHPRINLLINSFYTDPKYPDPKYPLTPNIEMQPWADFLDDDQDTSESGSHCGTILT